jgi:hypothetical protein
MKMEFDQYRNKEVMANTELPYLLWHGCGCFIILIAILGFIGLLIVEMVLNQR